MAGTRQLNGLIDRLGLLHAQMAHGSIKKAQLTYCGDVARRSTKLLTAAFAAGLLEYRLEHVNIECADPASLRFHSRRL